MSSLWGCAASIWRWRDLEDSIKLPVVFFKRILLLSYVLMHSSASLEMSDFSLYSILTCITLVITDINSAYEKFLWMPRFLLNLLRRWLFFVVVIHDCIVDSQPMMLDGNFAIWSVCPWPQLVLFCFIRHFQTVPTHRGWYLSKFSSSFALKMGVSRTLLSNSY